MVILSALSNRMLIFFVCSGYLVGFTGFNSGLTKAGTAGEGREAS